MKVPTRMKAPTEEFLRVVQALNDLAKQQGISVHVTVPGCESTPTHAENAAGKARAVRKRQRADLAWLETELRKNELAFAQLKGNYAAVHNTQIVAVSEDKEIALLGAAKSLGSTVDREDILVVPICVLGADSEDEWLAVKVKLGMNA